MSFRRLKAIIKKEVKHLLRDRKMLIVVFFFPAFLLAVFGYAVNFDVKNINLAVWDQSNTPQSREFYNDLAGSAYFNLSEVLNNSEDIDEVLDKKDAQVALVIPKDFATNLNRTDRTAKVQFIIDGVDGNTATIIKNYVEAFTAGYSQKLSEKIALRTGMRILPAIDIRPLFMFNPTLETTKFLIPGLIAFVLIVTTIVTVSLSLVREKERGTIEQINVSSINTVELLIGKTFPYILIGLINSYTVLGAGHILFGISVSGSHALLFLSIITFIIACASIGIFISVISDTQQVAFTAAVFASMLPSVILSGFIFPIESMPPVIQVFSNITPAKFFIIALRSIILKGVGLGAFGINLLYLLIFPAVFTLLSLIISRKKEGAA